MLALQSLTIALTLSYAAANPIAGRSRMVLPVAPVERDSNELSLRDLEAPAAAVHNYVPDPRETSLTRKNGSPVLTRVVTPLAVLGVVSCVLTAACVGITALVGILCCQGIIKNCDQADTASLEKDDAAHFTKETFKPVFFNLVASTYGWITKTDVRMRISIMWGDFMGRLFENNPNPPSSVEVNTFNNYLKHQTQ
ncbi:hypothetical protein C8J57DRAFT_1499898 [Mycena rebaudengoi]|nr:hypothetical protein C8J57DRAFT_1499898 [Mycena rebaudengoi]